MTNATTLQQLREQTADLHRQVESSAVMSALLQKDLGVDQYLQALQVLASFVRHYEPALIQTFGSDSAYRYLPRLPLLSADIRALNGNRQHQLAEAPAVADASWYELVGAAYVLEGSTQGGKILARRINDKLGLVAGINDKYGVSYFNLYQQGSWEQFKNWVSQLELTTAQQSEIANGAEYAFRYLHEAINQATLNRGSDE